MAPTAPHGGALPTTAGAWRVEQITGDGAMYWRDLPMPAPGPGHYLVRVEAAGLNFLDTLMIRGRYQRKPTLPFTPGVELAGRIVAAGADTPLELGRRVFATVETGAFAAYARIPASAAKPIDDDVAAETAIFLLGVNYPTSYYALHHRAQLRPGETVLVHAAAGGVGSAAAEIARAAGCRVIATAGSAEKRQACLARGADAALDPAAPNWVDQLRELTAGQGADVIYDPVGGDVALQSLRGLAWHGRYLVIGFASGTIPALPANRLLLKEAVAIGIAWGATAERDPAIAVTVADALLGMFRRGILDPIVGGRFPLDQAPHALDLLQRRASMGKLFLIQDR